MTAYLTLGAGSPDLAADPTPWPGLRAERQFHRDEHSGVICNREWCEEGERRCFGNDGPAPVFAKWVTSSNAKTRWNQATIDP